ncbi:hypothetical protein WM009_20895 [Vibrio vulnificus]|uniref:hypothetical protein n=1 Tax=Vibrio vulnificus TaxID=672 RepID=UPI0030EC8030|nr:hypothetical protein [Vibrio cholerae]
MNIWIGLKSQNLMDSRELDTISIQYTDSHNITGEYCDGYAGSDTPFIVASTNEDSRTMTMHLRFNESRISKLTFELPIEIGSKAKYSVPGQFESRIFEVTVCQGEV